MAGKTCRRYASTASAILVALGAWVIPAVVIAPATRADAADCEGAEQFAPTHEIDASENTFAINLRAGPSLSANIVGFVEPAVPLMFLGDEVAFAESADGSTWMRIRMSNEP